MISKDGVENREELAHGRGERDFGRAPGRAKPLVEGGDGWVATNGGNCGHVQDSADGGAAARHYAPAAQRTAVWTCPDFVDT